MAYLQVKQHRDQRAGRIHNMYRPEKPQEEFEGGWRQSLPTPFARRQVNLDV